MEADVLINTQASDGALLIRVAYTLIPLMSIPVLFLAAKQSLIDMLEGVNESKVALILYGLAVLLAMVMDGVGLAYAFIGACSTMLNTQVIPPLVGFMKCSENRQMYKVFFAVSVVNFSVAVCANLLKIFR